MKIKQLSSLPEFFEEIPRENRYRFDNNAMYNQHRFLDENYYGRFFHVFGRNIGTLPPQAEWNHTQDLKGCHILVIQTYDLYTPCSVSIHISPENVEDDPLGLVITVLKKLDMQTDPREMRMLMITTNKTKSLDQAKQRYYSHFDPKNIESNFKHYNFDSNQYCDVYFSRAHNSLILHGRKIESHDEEEKIVQLSNVFPENNDSFKDQSVKNLQELKRRISLYRRHAFLVEEPRHIKKIREEATTVDDIRSTAQQALERTSPFRHEQVTRCYELVAQLTTENLEEISDTLLDTYRVG